MRHLYLVLQKQGYKLKIHYSGLRIIFRRENTNDILIGKYLNFLVDLNCSQIWQR